MYYKNDDVCGWFYVALRSNFNGFWLQLAPQDGLMNRRRGRRRGRRGRRRGPGSLLDRSYA